MSKIEKAKRAIYADLLTMNHCANKAEKDAWLAEFDADLEAYVQARITEKNQ
jgi:hypothetical protein